MPAPTHLNWEAETLWQRLEPLLPGLTVEVLAEAGSTNAMLLERARRGDALPALLVAERQTAGRGRQGRTWHSSPAASLTFSLSLPLARGDWSGLSLAVGLSLAESLDPAQAEQPPRIGLKWPNDLLLDSAAGAGRKLCGILIESMPVGSRRLAVIGIGLNVAPIEPGPGDPAVDPSRPPVEGGGAAFSQGYACLRELHPGITAPEALARVAEPLVRMVLGFEQAGFAAYRTRYEARDVFLGHEVVTTLADGTHGIAEGVADDGALRVRAGDRLVSLIGGEVSVRRTAPEAPPC